MVPTFKDKLSIYGEDKQPNEFQHAPRPGDVFPFSDLPSGSKWTRKHIDWLRICFEWDHDEDKLFTKKSSLEQSSIILRFLEDRLNLSWSQVIAGTHETGSLYDRLRALALGVKFTPAYQPQSVPASSSPAGSQESDDLNVIYNPHGIDAHSEAAADPVLNISPSASPKTISKPSASEQTSGQSPRRSEQMYSSILHASSDDDDHSSETSSPGQNPPQLPVPRSSAAPVEDIDGSKSRTKLEKDVEFATTAFLYLIIEAFKSTNAGITEGEAEEQDLTFEYA